MAQQRAQARLGQQRLVVARIVAGVKQDLDCRQPVNAGGRFQAREVNVATAPAPDAANQAVPRDALRRPAAQNRPLM
jgi:hypothetical protein